MVTAEQLIAAVRSNGNDPRDLRDAAHEAHHAIEANVKRGKWDTMPAMTIEDVKERAESEGFDYAFTSYSNFSDVADPEFHRLREAFLDARNALSAYIHFDE